jgi:hypothetical protein
MYETKKEEFKKIENKWSTMNNIEMTPSYLVFM